ncbi:nucleoside monophosphate kinase [Patescibacteria group bacterium]|nr:nucleoside monophosphate kinase [Patescibacteria group bacterium]
MRKVVLILIGPPGSGKGTQAGLILQEHKMKYLSVGEMLRREISKETAFGKKIKKYVNAGLLVAGGLVADLVINTIDASKKSIILDGFPRKISQARKLEKYLLEKNTKNIVVEIALNSQKEILQRISGRRYCEAGHLYHLKYNPPKVAGICDICGRELKIRADANPEVIKKRLAIYRAETKPLIDYYKKKKQFYSYHKVDGNQPIESVYKDLRKKLNAELK